MPAEGHASTRQPGSRAPFEQVLERFEVAWQNGTSPAIEQFVPADLADKQPLLHELIKIDLEYRWAYTDHNPAGPSADQALPAEPRLEDYAALLPELGPLERLPVDLIEEEYWVRQRWGDQPSHEDYARRFPGHGAALRSALVRLDAELEAELASQSGHVEEVSPNDEHSGNGSAAEPRCPHCRHALEVPADPSVQDITCPACGAAINIEVLRSAPTPEPKPPCSKLGRYELGKLLGLGAFGTVWQARDTELEREVAVKLPRNGQLWNKEEEERFLREGRAAAQLVHPGIVAVYDVGRAQDTLYIVSELVRGVTLSEWLQGGQLTFLQAAELVAQVAEALDYAHSQGVVHRDIKPSNIMLELEEAPADAGARTAGRGRSDRRPLVMDFGLALRDVGEVTMTLDGQLLGTPAYMSPEQVRDPHAVDGRSDVYSLGVILYQLLTGELPFRGLTRMLLLLQVVSEEPRPPRRLNERIPRDLETICLRCLAKEPAARYRTASALAADLRRWLSGQQIVARPLGPVARLWHWIVRRPMVAGAVGLAVVALVAFTGAPGVTALVAITVASVLFAMHKAKTAEELSQAIDDLKGNQQKTAAVLHFAVKQFALAGADRLPASSEARNERCFARARELVRAVLFELPEKLGELPGAGPAHAYLIRTTLAYLDGLAKEVGDDSLLLRELAVAYARVGELQKRAVRWNAEAAGSAMTTYQKSLEIFAALASAHRDNAQAQRDLAASRGKLAELRRTLAKASHRSARQISEAHQQERAKE